MKATLAGGFSTQTLSRLGLQLRAREQTRDGRLRHPPFVGLREDKPACEVVRERVA